MTTLLLFWQFWRSCAGTSKTTFSLWMSGVILEVRGFESVEEFESSDVYFVHILSVSFILGGFTYLGLS